jgi:hypothetical protein
LPALLAIAGAAYLILVGVDSRPIADDWLALASVPHVSLWTYVHGGWLTGSGRFTATTGIWVAIRLLGSSAVNITPPAMLLALWCLCGWSLRSWARAVRATVGWVEALALALLGTVSMLVTAPSLFDVVGWFTASFVYLLAVVAVAAVVALYGHLSPRFAEMPRRAGALLLLVAYIAAGCDEIAGALIFLAAGLAVATLRDLSSVEIRRTGTLAMCCVMLGALAGTAVNLLGPGSRHRASAQGAHVSLSAAARTAWQNLSFFRTDAHDGVVLLAIATGVMAWQLLPAPRSVRGRRWLGAWGAFLLVVPWVVTSALTAWAGSTESDDRSPFRAAFLFTGSAAVAIAVFVLLLLSAFPAVLRAHRATIVATLLSAAGIVGFAHHASPVISAERLRARAVAGRDSSVHRQLSEHRRFVTLEPAPLLTVYTQALDLAFNPAGDQRTWLVAALRRYYDIPGSDRVVATAMQPRDYCLPSVAASWVGVRSCQGLDKAGRDRGSKRPRS